MTSLRKRGAVKILAILMAVSLSQLYVQIGMAQGGPRLISGRLTTTGGRPITVNGASTASGASILTGATIETPDAVGASIDLPIITKKHHISCYNMTKKAAIRVSVPHLQSNCTNDAYQIKRSSALSGRLK